jgi:hypothetical protein
MISDLIKVFKPEERGCITNTEVAFVKEKLCLEDMDEIQLQNMRDMVVMLLSQKSTAVVEKDFDEFVRIEDIMSAITCVIDTIKFKNGYEV